jgi:hypothetical protein
MGCCASRRNRGGRGASRASAPEAKTWRASRRSSVLNRSAAERRVGVAARGGERNVCRGRWALKRPRGDRARSEAWAARALACGGYRPRHGGADAWRRGRTSTTAAARSGRRQGHEMRTGSVGRPAPYRGTAGPSRRTRFARREELAAVRRACRSTPGVRTLPAGARSTRCVPRLVASSHPATKPCAFFSGAYAWNELPQPQLFTALGLSNVKPRRSIPS